MLPKFFRFLGILFFCSVALGQDNGIQQGNHYTVSLNVRLVDAATKQGITKVSGYIIFGDDYSLFLAQPVGGHDPHDEMMATIAKNGGLPLPAPDALGKIHTPILVPSGVRQLEHLMEYQELKKDPTVDSLRLNQARKNVTVYIGIEAPGYATCTYALSPEVIADGKIVTIALQPSLKVTGRIVLDAPQDDFGISFMHLAGSEQGNFTYPNFFWTKIDKKGQFAFNNMPPGSNWILKAGFNSGFRTMARDLSFHAGVNDLGNIPYPTSGRLTVQVQDQDAKPVPNARVTLQQHKGSEYWKSASNEKGIFQENLTYIPDTRQLLRVTSPANTSEIEKKGSPSSWYERLVDLNYTKDNRYAVTIEKGHSLTVHIPVTPSLLRAVDYYREKALRETPEDMPDIHWKKDDLQRQPKQRLFGLTAIRLFQTDGGTDGFAYCRNFVIPINEAPLNKDISERVIRIDDVPSGRFALQLIGSLYLTPSESISNASWPEILGYAAFVMPGADHDLSVSTEGADVEVAIDHPPADASLLSGVSVSLERTEPLSTSFNDDWGDAGIVTSIKNPFLRHPAAMPFINCRKSLMDALPKDKTFRQYDYFVYIYRPALFPNMPPGTYRVRIIRDSDEWRGQKSAPDYEQKIKVSASAQKAIRVSIPGKFISELESQP